MQGRVCFCLSGRSTCSQEGSPLEGVGDGGARLFGKRGGHPSSPPTSSPAWSTSQGDEAGNGGPAASWRIPELGLLQRGVRQGVRR